MYRCFACNENTVDSFYKKEQALFHLLNKTDLQKEVFLEFFICHELIEKILRYYSNDFLEIYENSIFYKDYILTFHKYFIETNDIYSNILFDYMKRYHKIWCCIDENNKVIWINTCKII